MKIIALGISLFALLSAFAQDSQVIPRTINYQGRLADAQGLPIGGTEGGTFRLRFQIFPNPADGVAVWAEERNVVVINGIFNVALGATGGEQVGELPFDLAGMFSAPARYLEVTVVSGPTITEEQTLLPRQQLQSVPFTFVAQNAQRAEVATIAESLIPELAKALNPPGTIIAYAGQVTDDGSLIEPVPGYLLCNGAVIDATAEDGKYQALQTAIESAWGSGGDEIDLTFALPNLRGLVLRGTGSQVIASRAKVGPAVGGIQADQSNQIRDVRTNGWQGSMNRQNTTTSMPESGSYSAYFFTGEGGDGGSRQQMRIRVHGRETRVAAAGVHYLIKY